MFREFLVRIGTFFILIGIGILVLFIASDSAGAANFDYLFWGVSCMMVGWFLRKRREPPAPADRFGLLRGLRRGGRDRKERR